MRATAAAVILVALVLAPVAGAGVRIAGVDTSGYPQVRVTVVASAGAARPRLDENGIPAAGLQAVHRDSNRRCHSDDARDIGSAGTDVAFLAATVRQWDAGDISAQQQSTHRLRAAELVSGHAHRRQSAGGEIYR